MIPVMQVQVALGRVCIMKEGVMFIVLTKKHSVGLGQGTAPQASAVPVRPDVMTCTSTLHWKPHHIRKRSN